jgi:hypothetical protein
MRTSWPSCGGTSPRRSTRTLGPPSPTLYHEGLERFGRELEDLTGPVWREQYQQGKGTPPGPMKRQRYESAMGPTRHDR